MTALRLMIALCVGALVTQAHAAALPVQNDYIVFRDDPPKVTPNAIPNVAISPFESIKVMEMRVRSEITLRYARTSVVTRVRNPDARAQEATFRMLLPDTAFISNFTMILDGTSYTAYVEKKEEAAQIYRQAVSEGAAAAHIATKARDSYEFTVSVNVEGNSTAEFDLRYEELLVRRSGLYHHAVNLQPGSLVPDMEVLVHIKESQKITKLRVPEVRTGNEVDATENDPQNSKAVTRYSTSKREVTVTFAPDLPEQERLAKIYEGAAGDFAIDTHRWDSAISFLEKLAGPLSLRLGQQGGGVTHLSIGDQPRGRCDVTASFQHQPQQGPGSSTTLDIKRKSRENSSSDAFIGYSSDEDKQNELERKSMMLGQFVVQYDVERTNNGEILVNDGYFVHFLAPTSLPPLSKYVVFVLDTSGSMYGRKIEQLRTAMAAILSDLNPNDYFSIVEFNSIVKVHDLSEADEVMSYMHDQSLSLVVPERASPENIQRAKLIVSEFDASGATDIYGALDVALNLTKHDVPLDKTPESANTNASSSSNNDNTGREVIRVSERVECEPIIIFLTDGEANKGEVINSRIVSLITAKNSGVKRASIYSLAFGDDADRVFLRELSLRNEGFMRHIYEAADAALQLRDFYRQVASPLLADVRFLYPRKQILEGSLSIINFRTLNAGAEAAVVGKIADNVTEITPQVRGLRGSEDGARRELYEVSSKVAVGRAKDSHLPLERLWAYLTIKQLLDKRDAADEHGADENSAEERALAIALKYGFVTPLTSLVVVKPKESKVREAEPESLSKPHDANRVAAPPVMPPFVPAGKRRNYISATATAATKRATPGEQGSPATHRPGTNGLVRYSPRTYDVSYSYNTITDFSNPAEPAVLITSTNTQRKRASTTVNVPSTTASTTTTTQAVYTTSAAPVGDYRLDEFVWASSLLNTSTGALVVLGDNGTQVTLELTRDTNPPKAEGGDEECSSGSPAVGAASPAGGVCVYLTRCAAARHIAAEDYAKSYCVVNDRYAGVCCPRAEVDKDPKKPSS